MTLRSLLSPTALLFFALLPIRAQESNGSWEKGDPALEFKSLADSLNGEKQYEGAVIWLDKAMEIYKDHDLLENYFNTGVQKAVTLQLAGLHNEAIAIFESLIDCCGEKVSPTELATAHHKAGVSFFYLNDFRRANIHLLAALKIREEHPQGEERNIALGYLNTGRCYYHMGYIERAKDQLEKALILQRQEPYSFLANTYLHLGRVCDLNGDAEAAESYLNSALSRYEEDYNSQPSQLAEIYSDLAAVYCDKQGKSQAARKFAFDAIKLLDSEKPGDPINMRILAGCYLNLGIAAQTEGKFHEALEFHLKSLSINQKYFGSSSAVVADNHNNIGILQRKLGQYSKALVSLETSIRINNKNNDRLSLAANYDNLGDLFLELNKSDQALESWQTALHYLVPGFEEKNIHSNPDIKNEISGNPMILLTVLSSKAKGLSKLYNSSKKLEDLRASYQTALILEELIDKRRRSYRGEKTKGTFLARVRPVFETAIQTCLKLYEETNEQFYQMEAFRFAEKSKSVILLEALRDSRAKSYSGIPNEYLQKERDYKFDINWYEKEIFLIQANGGEKSNILPAHNDSLLSLKLQYEVFENELEKSFPQYHNARYESRMLTLEEISSQLLKENTALIEYFLGENNIWAFVVGKNHLNIYSLGEPGRLSQLIDSLRTGLFACRNIKSGVTCKEGDSQFLGSASELYKLLLSPFAGSLPENLMIIPDGQIGYIPFEVLFRPFEEGYSFSSFSDLPYLVKTHRISYNYSATLLGEMKQPLFANKKKKILAFAPSFDNVNVESPAFIGSSESRKIEDQLSPLMFNVREVEAIEDIFSTDAYLNDEARKELFLKIGPDYRILHLSSHALVNDENPKFSFVAFAQNGDSLEFDKQLYVGELYNLSLESEMVVLSACNTSFGSLYQGEGIISLARAFSFAGARSLVTSLWSVNDQKTATLIEAFYMGLSKGLDKDEALQKAKLQMINDPSSSHPYYWAAFIPVGNMNPVDIGRNPWQARLIWVFLMLSAVAVAIWIIRTKRNSRRN